MTANPPKPPDALERRVRVNLGPRSYDAVAGSGVLPEVGAMIAALPGPGRSAMLIVDAGLPGAVSDAAAASLARAGFRVARAAIAPSEAAKSLRTLEALLVTLTRERLERGDPVVALGGGIVGDVAGFAAAVYRRGVPFVQCPTTLLAMVDASVGGKTGVNLSLPAESGHDAALKKNMLGAFHQPRLVIADTATLASLPLRHFRCGLAECIKHGLISAPWGDPDLGAWTRANLASILRRDASVLVELVARNIAVKARVVESDEHETSSGSEGRIALNLGHTFAHALEGCPQLDLQHGEAVGLGLLAAARCSVALGHAEAALVASIEALLSEAGLPTVLPSLPDPRALLYAMHDDKKVSGGRLRLILPVEGARCIAVEAPPEEIILRAIRSLARSSS